MGNTALRIKADSSDSVVIPVIMAANIEVTFNDGRVMSFSGVESITHEHGFVIFTDEDNGEIGAANAAQVKFYRTV